MHVLVSAESRVGRRRSTARLGRGGVIRSHPYRKPITLSESHEPPEPKASHRPRGPTPTDRPPDHRPSASSCLLCVCNTRRRLDISRSAPVIRTNTPHASAYLSPRSPQTPSTLYRLAVIAMRDTSLPPANNTIAFLFQLSALRSALF
jgi:hypothetical protein